MRSVALCLLLLGCKHEAAVVDAAIPDSGPADDGGSVFDGAIDDLAPTATVPPIPLGYDAYTRWDLWPRLRLGVRTYMRSTFDRTGGNEGADASHFLRQDDAQHNVVFDVTGHGVLSFMRANHWHGSPWHYLPDGQDFTISETSTPTGTAVASSVWLPEVAFPAPLALTWSVTNGADLSWVSVPFTQSLEVAFERTHYGTGYFIYTLVGDPDDLLSPLGSFSEAAPPAAPVAVLQGVSSPTTAMHHAGTLSMKASTTVPIVSLTDAPAQIRALTFTVAAADADAFSKATLHIRWDGQTTPSVDAPVALLFGTGTVYNRANLEYLVKALPATVHFTGGNVTFTLLFPMPYFTSAALELVSTAAVSSVAWTVDSEPYTDPPAWSGYLHATYVDHGTPVAGQDLVLLDTTLVEGGNRDYCGHLVGTSFTFSDEAVLSTLEGDPRFFFDDSGTPQAQGTGTEEWGGGGDYWGGKTMTLPLVGHPVGAPSASSAKSAEDQIESAYRFLLADAMPFGKNARIQLEHGGTNDSTEHYTSVTFWYGKKGACLVQSDTLHVGDTADEAAHLYVSPTAISDTLSSRYDVGVDHVGSTVVVPATMDTGRHMTGTTELRLAIDPANVGVLLRRKLDQGYADQRAEVYVADDSDTAPFVHAATWYTAGSHRCIYSNPDGELDPAVHTLETSNRQWRDDELILPRTLTQGRSKIRLRLVFVPGAHALFPGDTTQLPNAWSEYRYTAYSWLLPK